MLNGKGVTLRPVQEEDLPQLYEHILDVENRGKFYPASIQTLTALRKELAEDGFWRSDFGMLVIIDNESGKLVGQIVWFKTVQYMNELEIGYIMYDRTVRSRGGMTEACKLLTQYLFDTKPVNRIRLCIATENGPSRRVAEKSGYLHEGTQRGAAWARGEHYDMELYAVTRADWDAREEGVG
jgi:[ribosomal protein S5]-alanine N-acetyltransferase